MMSDEADVLVQHSTVMVQDPGSKGRIVSYTVHMCRVFFTTDIINKVLHLTIECRNRSAKCDSCSPFTGNGDELS